ncbi:MAG: type II toxin-antitoxin system VapC family toxin [Deltaproteobacteria bacterium]|nr:type II toxin-antitoxin system VapC family toxin [Deltaproteobacteria bacterium]
MYLLDTDTLIYSLKAHPEVVANLNRHRRDPMAVSVVSLMELYYGDHKSQRAESNLAKVRAIERAFRVLPLGAECAETFGSLKASLDARGCPLDDFDLCLAATALSHNLVLVTKNTRHFERIDGLRQDNWTMS